MIATPPMIQVPIQADESGAIRVSGTRVTLDVLIARYHQHYSPEAIHEAFPTVPTTDIYAVISYYLAHRAEVVTYLARRDAEAERIRLEWEAKYPPQVTRAELLARLDAKKDASES